MELDIILEADLNAAEVKELGLLAESFGFRAIWTQNYARARDAFLIAMPLALASSRIRVGVMAVSAYEMHPLKIANAMLTLNEAAPAGACVVIGAGGEWPEVLGVGYGKRITGTREALTLIKHAASGEVTYTDGEVYNAHWYAAPWSTDADSEPLVYGGSTGPQMVAMAAGVADGVLMSDMQPQLFDWSLPALRKAIQEHGRDNFLLSNFLAWHVKKDRGESLYEARRELILRGWLEQQWLEAFLESDEVDFVRSHIDAFLTAYRDRSGDIKGVPAAIVDKLIAGLSLSGDYGDIDHHIGRLHQFREAGFTEIALRIHDNPADSIRLIGERVLPEFR